MQAYIIFETDLYTLVCLISFLSVLLCIIFDLLATFLQCLAFSIYYYFIAQFIDFVFCLKIHGSPEKK